MLTERRRSALPPEFLMRVGLAWVLVSIMLLAINWQTIATMRFPDPDDTMRLIQVRDLIGGQGWFDPAQYRVDAPGGGVRMHWSRLVDLPLAIVIIALTPILGAQAAETAALVIVPLITLGVVMVLAARIAWRLLGDEETTLTALILAISVPIIFQLGPMRIDHHGWQMVCALAAVNGMMARSQKIGGWVIGASLATWMSISIEGLPLSAAIFGILAIRWLRNRNDRTLLLAAIQSLAVTSALLFVATRGFGDLKTYCDAISPLHLAIFAWGAGVITILGRLGPIPSGALVAGFAIAAAGALGMIFTVSPQCASGGGFAELDPLVREMWYVNVKEGMPVWQQTLTVVLQNAITPAIGLYAAISLAGQSRDWLRKFWTDYALVLAAAYLISLLVMRAGAVACLIAAPPLAWQLARWLRAARNMKGTAPRLGALTAVALALLPTLPLSLSALVLPAHARVGGAATGNIKVSTCKIEDSAPILNALPQAEVFAPLDISPKLLLLSHHSVPATGHHRGNATMREVIATSLGTSEQARKTLRQRGSAFVALCPDLLEPRTYEAEAPDGFVSDLLKGNAPDWLEPIETAEGTSFKLWRVRPE